MLPMLGERRSVGAPGPKLRVGGPGSSAAFAGLATVFLHRTLAEGAGLAQRAGRAPDRLVAPTPEAGAARAHVVRSLLARAEGRDPMRSRTLAVTDASPAARSPRWPLRPRGRRDADRPPTCWPRTGPRSLGRAAKTPLSRQGSAPRAAGRRASRASAGAGLCARGPLVVADQAHAPPPPSARELRSADGARAAQRPRRAPPRRPPPPRRWRRSPPASRAATRRPTPATGSTASTSSPLPPGRRSAAPATPRRPPRPSRIVARPRCYAQAGPGRGPSADSDRRPPSALVRWRHGRRPPARRLPGLGARPRT